MDSFGGGEMTDTDMLKRHKEIEARIEQIGEVKVTQDLIYIEGWTINGGPVELREFALAWAIKRLFREAGYKTKGPITIPRKLLRRFGPNE